MDYRNSLTNYGSVTQFFHWVLFLLITIMLIVGFIAANIENEAIEHLLVKTHKLTGVAVLILACCWVLWSTTQIKPSLPFTMPNWEKFAAHFVHFLLYALIIAMPLSGMIMATAAGKPPTLFGIKIAVWGIPESKSLGDLFWEIHETLAWVIIALAALHICAALKHHFYDRDNILMRMLPTLHKGSRGASDETKQK